MGMAHRDRDRAVVGVVTAACCVAALFLGVRPVPSLAAAAAALATFGCRPRSHQWTGAATGAAGLLLLVATFAWPGRGTAEGSVWHLVAVGAVLLLLTAAVRRSSRRQLLAGGGLGAAAVAVWTVPLVPDASFFEYLGMIAFWSVPIVGAVVVGGYPRRMEDRRRKAVLAARRAQQLELAHDLHDFVAHDVSGIVVQAQAARFVARHDPAAAIQALERIERAGLAALASIDRTVRMLRAADRNTDDDGDGDVTGGDPAEGEAAGGPRTVLPGTAQLGEVVDRFSETGDVRARLDLAPGVAEALSREGAATVHRVVVEALTNVRRHAPGAAGVRVVLTTDGTNVEVSVTNDGGRGRSAHLPGLPRLERGAGGGGGLLALAERVRTCGGTFASGPYREGWRVTAVLPATGPHATAS